MLSFTSRPGAQLFLTRPIVQQRPVPRTPGVAPGLPHPVWRYWAPDTHLLPLPGAKLESSSLYSALERGPLFPGVVLLFLSSLP